jgi:hypothetical protein
MAVEQLLTRQINIADFHPVEVKEKSKAEGMFYELKNSPFYYDIKLENWYSMARRERAGAVYSPNDQLIGMLVEGLFNKEKTQKQFEAWTGRREYLKDKLMEILIEGLFDKKNAQTHFKELKQTQLYEEGTWHHSTESDSIYTSSQLLDVLIEGMFDKDRAERRYEELKESDFYDSELGLWNLTNKEIAPILHPTTDQLLGISVEGIFDKEKARRKYEELKKTSFYDDEQNEWWNHTLSSHNRKGTDDQLWGIHIEAMLEEPEFTSEKTEPIPEVRRF